MEHRWLKWNIDWPKATESAVAGILAQVLSLAFEAKLGAVYVSDRPTRKGVISNRPLFALVVLLLP